MLMNWLNSIKFHPAYRFMRRCLCGSKGKATEPSRELELSPLGFHGDAHLLALVSELMARAAAFVETGTEVGSTARWVAATWPKLPVYSCELNREVFNLAHSATVGLSNVRLYNLASDEFLPRLYGEHPELAERPVLFWLDAHGVGFKWPLRFEVQFITSHQKSGAILIDDFEVPGQPQFRFDSYDGQVCNFEHIEPSLSRERSYRLVYPQYAEQTSPFHPLVGYAAILFGEQMPAPRLSAEQFVISERRR
jgi:hypothetical protein